LLLSPQFERIHRPSCYISRDSFQPLGCTAQNANVHSFRDVEFGTTGVQLRREKDWVSRFLSDTR
jgi:hypothetical protein